MPLKLKSFFLLLLLIIIKFSWWICCGFTVCLSMAFYWYNTIHHFDNILSLVVYSLCTCLVSPRLFVYYFFPSRSSVAAFSFRLKYIRKYVTYVSFVCIAWNFFLYCVLCAWIQAFLCTQWWHTCCVWSKLKIGDDTLRQNEANNGIQWFQHREYLLVLRKRKKGNRRKTNNLVNCVIWWNSTTFFFSVRTLSLTLSGYLLFFFLLYRVSSIVEVWR